MEQLQETARRAIGNKFVVAGRIETHGTSRLYHATQADTGRIVALRELEPREHSVADVLGTLTKIAAVSSRFLVDLVDAAPLGPDGLYVAHALLHGESLTARLTRKGALPPAEAAALNVRILKGLDSLHRRGIVHGGLRPSRVFHERTKRRGWHVKLLSSAVPTVTRAEARSMPVLARYAPPEWLDGEPWTTQSDVWCAAAVLYVCVALRSPFEGQTPGEIVANVLAGHATPLESLVKDVPPELAKLVAEGLSTDPAARPADARTMLERLLTLYPEPDRAPTVSVTEQQHWTRGKFVGGRDAPPLALPPVQESRTAIARRQKSEVKHARTTAIALTACCAAAVVVLLFVQSRRRERELLARLARARSEVPTLAPAGAAVPSGPQIAAPVVAPAPAADAGMVVAVAPTSPRGTTGRRPSSRTGSSGQNIVGAPVLDPGGATGVLSFRSSVPCAFMLDGVQRGQDSTFSQEVRAGTHNLTCHSRVDTERIVVVVRPNTITRVQMNSRGETEVFSEERRPTP